ncbi:MAG TPA: hypothetical protein DIT64_17345 [Verrucomicrobiales bacterium]|nr:hypothetical protein [Verrucomicrobiales bacterium]
MRRTEHNQSEVKKASGNAAHAAGEKRELEARRAAAHYRGLFENNTAGVVFVDRGMVITGVNRTFVKLVGRKKDALVGAGIIELCSVPTRGLVSGQLQEAARNTRRRTTLEMELVTKRGEILCTQVSPTFFMDEAGGLDGGVMVMTDVTAQKQALQDLWEKNQFYEALIRDASVMIVILDENGVVTGMNRAAERISGFSAAEVSGQELWRLFHLDPSQADLVRERMEQLISGEVERVADPFRFIRKDGSVCHAETQTSLLRRPDGSPGGFVTTAVDVTERMRLESELVRIVEDEQTRIGNDLHDGLGQMLTGAATLLEMLVAGLEGQQKKDGARVYEILRETVHEARRISHGLSPAAVKNRGLAGGLKLLAEHVNAAGQIHCATDIDSSVRVSDPAQETHIYRIAQEAVSNAVRHSRTDLVKITLRRHEGGCILEVRDRGIGFDPSHPKSDGIGLRVMRHRANIIGANLSIDSAPGWETVVRCRFRPSEKDSLRQNDKRPAKSAPQRRMRKAQK